jgi:hypothetical protein
VLLTRGNDRAGMIGLAPGEAKERDLSWLDWSVPVDLSADGRTVLFGETGEGGGPKYAVYLRKTDGSPACCRPGSVKRSPSPAIRSITSGCGGFPTGNNWCSRATRLDTDIVSMWSLPGKASRARSVLKV